MLSLDELVPKELVSEDWEESVAAADELEEPELELGDVNEMLNEKSAMAPEGQWYLVNADLKP
jgi:hypothetical protein